MEPRELRVIRGQKGSLEITSSSVILQSNKEETQRPELSIRLIREVNDGSITALPFGMCLPRNRDGEVEMSLF